MTDTTTKLNQFCCAILNGILGAPGWATPGQNWTAGGILEEILLPLSLPAEPKTGAGSAEWRAWASQPIALTLSKRQIEVIVACVKHFGEAKGLPAIYQLRPLLDLAGLNPEA